ncbi:MAG: glutathione S-transferase [Arenicella sp.]|jgi:glutathione S-transferase
MSLTLFHSPGTRSIRVRWLLEEMALPYDLKSIKYDGKYFASDEFKAINPMGKVPALYDNGALIVESIAIMEYLLQRFRPSSLSVSSDDAEYASYLQWLHMAESGMANYIAVSFGNTFDMDPYKVSDQYDAYCRFQITKALGFLETQLQDQDYLLKRGFSAADVSLGYTLFFAQTCTSTKFTDVVATYYQRIMSRPAAQIAMSDLKKR